MLLDRNRRSTRSCSIHLEALKCIPMELDAVTGAIRCDGHAVAHFHTLRHVLLETKAMHFQLRRIGCGSQQVDVYIMRAMRRDR